jgi:hypothetical protein
LKREIDFGIKAVLAMAGKNQTIKRMDLSNASRFALLASVKGVYKLGLTRQ